MIVEGYFMTADEEMMARGRLVTEYGETKKHFGLLISEATRMGGIYASLGSLLKSFPQLYLYDREEKEIKLNADTEVVLNSEKLRAARVNDFETGTHGI